MKVHGKDIRGKYPGRDAEDPYLQIAGSSTTYALSASQVLDHTLLQAKLMRGMFSAAFAISSIDQSAIVLINEMNVREE